MVPAYLSVLVGDLEEQCQAAVVEVVVQGDQGAVHAALQEDVGVVPQADALHPADDPLVAPHQHVCGRERSGLVFNRYPKNHFSSKLFFKRGDSLRRFFLFLFLILGLLASHFVLALLPAPLQFLPVIVELLQTHDSVL